jgi:RND family efflux transporter MFP subunit
MRIFNTRYIKSHPIKTLLSFLLVIFIVVLGWRIFAQQETISEDIIRIPKVDLINLEEYQAGGAFIDAIGEVESLEQVELKSQISERVRRINFGIGDAIKVGQVLVELNNTELFAQLKQVEGFFEAEQARLEELKKGARTEDIQIKDVDLKNTEQDLDNSYNNLLISLHDSFARADDAVRTKTTALFSGSKNTFYKLTFDSCDIQAAIDATQLRLEAEVALDNWRGELNSLELASTNNQIDSALVNGEGHLNLALELLNRTNDNLVTSCASENTSLDGARLNVNAARSIIVGAITSLNSQAQNVQRQKLLVERMKNEFSKLLAGATTEQMAAQEARVKSAQAQLQSAQAQFSKTIITSPINGNVASLPVRLGDLVSPGQLLGSIVNTSGLQVKTFVNSRDVVLITEGAEAVIENDAHGIVTRIAPSIDPATNKVEVVVAVNNESEDQLIIGQFTNIEIAVNEDLREKDVFLLPLQVVRATGEGAFIYVLDEQNIISQKKITLGRVIGELVEVLEGLQGTASILSSVRGLEPGQKVELGE